MQENGHHAPTPVPVAFLLCDQIIVEAGSGKKTIVGVFDRVGVRQFPATHSPAWLYIRVIDCEGEYEHRIEYVQVATQKILARANGTATSKNRHVYAEFVLPCPPLQLPEPGEYEFRLWLNEKFISRVRVTAHPVSGTEEGQ